MDNKLRKANETIMKLNRDKYELELMYNKLHEKYLEATQEIEDLEDTVVILEDKLSAYEPIEDEEEVVVDKPKKKKGK